MPSAECVLSRMPSVVAALMAVTLLSVDALAQPKPALTRDSDEPGRNPYVQSLQVTQNVTNCLPSLAQCSVILPAFPVGKRLVITYVAAAFFLDAGGNGAEVSLSAPGTGFILLPQPQLQGFLVDRHTVATPVTFYVEPG